MDLGPDVGIAVPTRLDGGPDTACTTAFHAIPLQRASEARLNGCLVPLELFEDSAVLLFTLAPSVNVELGGRFMLPDDVVVG